MQWAPKFFCLLVGDNVGLPFDSFKNSDLYYELERRKALICPLCKRFHIVFNHYQEPFPGMDCTGCKCSVDKCECTLRPEDSGAI